MVTLSNDVTMQIIVQFVVVHLISAPHTHCNGAKAARASSTGTKSLFREQCLSQESSLNSGENTGGINLMCMNWIIFNSGHSCLLFIHVYSNWKERKKNGEKQTNKKTRI